jgi:CMP-N-acetylneuraminic acid synthetase
VCEVNHNPLWSNIIDDSLSLKGFLKDDVLNKRSQDLEKYYQLNGAIYICKISKFIEEKGFFLKDNIYAFKMDRGSSIDIDERIDLKIAEALIENS